MTARTWRGLIFGLLLVLVLKALQILDFLGGFLIGLFGLDAKDMTTERFAEVVVALIVVAVVFILQNKPTARAREVPESGSEGEDPAA